MLLIDLLFLDNGLMSEQIQNIIYKKPRKWSALVVGRAGLDLYPQPSGSKTKFAESFASDVGGSSCSGFVSRVEVRSKWAFPSFNHIAL